jgi:Protein of unknown function (DUF1761)
MRQCIVTYPSSEVDNRTAKDQQERYTGDAMDASQVVAHINWLAVAVAAVAGFPLGALWYGPLFGSAWMAATGITKERARQANRVKIYVATLALNLVIATSLAMFIGPTANLQDGLFAGFMAGFTYVAAAFGITYLFEFRSLKLWAINAGYQVVVFSVMGAILGVWH